MSTPRTSNRLAGPLLASIFIHGGLDAYRNPEGKVKAAEKVTAPLASRIDFIPDDTAALVKANGALQVAAGALLAIGPFRRLAALALIGSIIPTTYAGHRFWEEVDDEKRAQQQAHFLKNLGVLGGLILAATEPPKRRKTHRIKAFAGPDWGPLRSRLRGTRSTIKRDASKVVEAAGRLASVGADLTSELASAGADLTSELRAKVEANLPSS
jgi:putative oxidoreductase